MPLPGPLTSYNYNPGCCRCSDFCRMDKGRPAGTWGPQVRPQVRPRLSLSSCIPSVGSKRPATQKHKQVQTDPNESLSIWTKDQQRGASQGQAGASTCPRGGQTGSRDFRS